MGYLLATQVLNDKIFKKGKRFFLFCLQFLVREFYTSSGTLERKEEYKKNQLGWTTRVLASPPFS